METSQKIVNLSEKISSFSWKGFIHHLIDINTIAGILQGLVFFILMLATNEFLNERDEKTDRRLYICIVYLVIISIMQLIVSLIR